MVYVGQFGEKDLALGADKQAVEKAKAETGLQYTNTKIVKQKGKMYLKIWVCDCTEFIL